MKKLGVVLFVIFLFACGEKVARVEEFNRTPQSHGGYSYTYMPTDKLGYKYRYIIFFHGYLDTEKYFREHPPKEDYPGDALTKGKDSDGDFATIIFSDSLPDNKFIPKWELKS